MKTGVVTVTYSSNHVMTEFLHSVFYQTYTDCAYRAKLLGIRVWYAAQCKIYHKVSSLMGGAKSRFMVYHATRGKIYFIHKFYSGYDRYYWLSRYFVGLFVGLAIKHYTWQEFKIKIRAFFVFNMCSK